METQLTQALAAPPTTWRLTHALNAKLAELRGKGFKVLWIESSRDDLTQLAVEGGDNAIELDADPEKDRAWYGEVEIRLSQTRSLTWLFVEGEVEGEVSAHIIGPPDPA